MKQLIFIAQNAAYVALILCFIYLAKLIADWRTTKFDDDYEIGEESNFAVGIRRAGLYIGIALGMIGPLSGDAQSHFLKDLSLLAVDGVTILIFLFFARFLSDSVILSGINNDDEVQNKNSAVGIVEFGIYLATGLILNGSFSGGGNTSIISGQISSLIFFTLGQVSLILLVLLYKKVAPFDLNEEVKKGNSSAAVAVSGMLISMGIVLKNAVSGNFVSWKSDLIGFGVTAVTSIILLIIMKHVVEFIFLKKTDLKTEIKRDQNVAAIVVIESIMIAFALVISTAI